jgi:DNA-binding transcriptional LysR family regulator
MDSQRLKYFISAANSLNFSEVARSNFVSQPTISHQISLLEQELGIELFSRQGKKLHLSKGGEFFLPIANRVLAEHHNAEIEIKRYKQGERGSVSVCVAETCRVDFMRCLAEFSKQYPAIPVNTNVALLGLSEEYLVKSNFDVCFVAEKTINGSDLFDYVVTNQDRLCLVIPENYPAPDDLSDLSFLDGLQYIGLNTYGTPLLMENIQRVFLTRNYVPHYGHTCSHMQDALTAVDTGMGFSILPYSIVQYYPREHIRCLLFGAEEFRVNCVAAWRKGRDNRSADFFIRVIKEIYGNSCPVIPEDNNGQR